MESIFSILSAVPDHRKGNHLVYPLDYILLVSFTALMSGYKTWRQFELYAQQHKDDLRREYTKYARRELDGYTPSHDTFSYVFGGLAPETFQKAFTDWITAVFEMAGQHICIDGKTMRGVKKLDPDSESHVVTAYIAGLKVALDEVFVSKKSNEINAIKELFDLIDIKGQTVTIDAIGTQTSIVDKITEKEADYILNVKSNQKGTLLEADGLFKPFYKKEIVRTKSEECGHGRVETRLMESIIDPMRFSDLEHYISLDKWQNMRSVHKMTRVRYDKRTGKESREVTYFISSHTDPEKVFKMIRDHWSVENNLHYCLDVIFREDQSLKRRGNAAKNINIIYKIALFFLGRMRAKERRSYDDCQKINALKEPSEILAYDYNA